MNGRATLSARETIVIDESEVSQLDELSLTSVMRQLTDTDVSETPQPGADEAPSETRSTPTESSAPQLSDSTINELLNGFPLSPYPHSNPRHEAQHARSPESSSNTGLSDETVDELLSADVLFPDAEKD